MEGLAAMRTSVAVIGLVALAALLAGCSQKTEEPPAPRPPVATTGAPVDEPGEEPTVEAEVLAEADGFAIPESVCVAGDGKVFISNIDAEDEGYWVDDGTGYITLADAETLEVIEERWADGFNGPKGLCILDGRLWVADNARIVAVSLDDPAEREVFEPEGAGQINDMATDGEIVYATDSEKSIIHRIKDGELMDPIPAPESVNGITFGASQMWGVSWDGHDVYRVDPTGVEPPEALGLAEHFESLDGVEELPDGMLVVSDFPGNKVCLVDPEALTVETIAELESPADLGLDGEAGVLYIPQFMVSKVVAIRLP
jgi:hypothetical protein